MPCHAFHIRALTYNRKTVARNPLIDGAHSSLWPFPCNWLPFAVNSPLKSIYNSLFTWKWGICIQLCNRRQSKWILASARNAILHCRRCISQSSKGKFIKKLLHRWWLIGNDEWNARTGDKHWERNNFPIFPIVRWITPANLYWLHQGPCGIKKRIINRRITFSEINSVTASTKWLKWPLWGECEWMTFSETPT